MYSDLSILEVEQGLREGEERMFVWLTVWGGWSWVCEGGCLACVIQLFPECLTKCKQSGGREDLEVAWNCMVIVPVFINYQQNDILSN
jgi:hypothetical protein